VLVDVRRLPGSRRSPQFDADEMASWLGEAGIEYLHLTELAGRRPEQRDADPALNAGWQNTSVKNYDDHTLTPEYPAGLRRLNDLASYRGAARLCGEPMPWRRHRRQLANPLAARGWHVGHRTIQAEPMPHELGRGGARPAVGQDGIVTYPHS